MFWAIQQALFFLPILRKFAKLKKTNQTKKQQQKTKSKTKKTQRDKVVGLQHPSLLKWNFSVIIWKPCK